MNQRDASNLQSSGSVSEATAGSPEAVSAANALRQRREHILDEFERRLSSIGSPLLTDPVAPEQLRRHASSILEDTALVLSGGDGYAPGNEDRLPEDIGNARASHRIRYGESFEAALELCEAALSEVERDSDLSTGTISLLARTLYRCTMERVSQASITYLDHLLRELGESYAGERRRLSRELHDRVASSLTVVHQNLDLYRSIRREDAARAEEKLELIERMTREALDSVRQVSAELRQTICPEGLETALSDFLATIIPEDTRASISVEGDEALAPDHVREELFLILREAVRNAVGHSGGKRIEIELATTPDLIRAEVADDGSGLDTDSPEFEPGTGIDAMTERAHLLGGSLSIRPSAAGGTTVEVQAPLDRNRR